MAIYMKYGSIAGRVSAAGHQGWIELTSFQWAAGGRVPTTGTSASREAGAAPLRDVVVTKVQDSVSTLLVQETLVPKGREVVAHFMPTAAAGGKPPKPYLSITLSNAMIVSYSISGHGEAGGAPQESFTINFDKMVATHADGEGKPVPSTNGWTRDPGS